MEQNYLNSRFQGLQTVLKLERKAICLSLTSRPYYSHLILIQVCSAVSLSRALIIKCVSLLFYFRFF